MSGLENKRSGQSCECENCCSSLVSQLLETISNQSQQMTALISSHAEQNILLTKIIDQNNDLISEILQEDDPDSQSSSQYLDGD
ncbi:hypothetical protein [Acinetobacter johnsonii]|uniref:hypothetical protein n=1 Tax=Acinetobacter johnsonii TaxID=40214 RepID=UPI0024478533|nr:hypothetical protein [Acinetobacter johnsonii]MDH1712817.1 hypothetical protein [Acinetobacter johnsonii]